MKVPCKIQRQLLEEARWVDCPRGSGWVNLECPDNSYIGDVWFRCTSSTGTAICFLPWNRRAKKRNDRHDIPKTKGFLA
jgi:hypothetical protein